MTDELSIKRDENKFGKSFLFFSDEHVNQLCVTK